MSTTLVKFGFGGVQEWISQARRVRDLAAGSEVISTLSGVAIHTAMGHGAEVLLPATPAGAAGSATRDWPHQIVVRLRDGDCPAAVSKSIAGAVQKRWMELGQQHVLATLPADHPEVSAATQHLECALEMYWAAVDAAAPEAIRQLQERYDDRRHTRAFDQLEQFAQRPPWSCRLCGVRPAIIEPGQAGRGRRMEGREDRLCAPCAIKRGLRTRLPDPAPSTHRLARARFYRDDRFRSLREGLTEKECGHLLDDLDEWMRPTEAAASPVGDRRRIRTALDRFRVTSQAAGALKALLGCAYYAIVVFDGDRMGRQFSHVAAGDAEDPFVRQRQLSAALGSFAASVRRYAADTNPLVLPVYLGGDDALLLAPLDELLPLIAKVDALWREGVVAAMATAAGAETPDPIGPPTLSLHASIVHAKFPLQAALTTAQASLKDAKERMGRNCISILTAPGAGSVSRLLMRWHELECLADAVEACGAYRRTDLARPSVAERKARSAAAISTTLLHSIMAEVPAYFDPGDPERKTPLGGDLRRALDDLRSGSGRRGSSSGWTALRNWLCYRAAYPSAPSWSDFDLAAEEQAVAGPVESTTWDMRLPRLGGQEAMVSAVSVLAFLTRQLDWSLDSAVAAEEVAA